MKASSPSRPAFSLIEIIAVIAIAAILLAFAIPALRNMGGGANIGIAARNLNGLLQLAASEARAKSTPVWVGFQNRTKGKDQQLIVVTVSSADGSPTFTEGVLPVGKPEIFNNVKLDVIAAAYGGRPTDATQLATAESDATFKMSVSGEEITFTKTILRFSPAGEVSIPPDSVRVVEIGLQPMRGDKEDPSPNTAVVQVTGMTGLSRVFQP